MTLLFGFDQKKYFLSQIRFIHQLPSFQLNTFVSSSLSIPSKTPN